MSVGGGGVDVSEDADLSGAEDDDRCFGGGGARGGFVTGSPGLLESCRKTSQTDSHFFFSISAAMYFWSAWKGEVVKVCVEVLTDECIEVWESLRLDP